MRKLSILFYLSFLLFPSTLPAQNSKQNHQLGSKSFVLGVTDSIQSEALSEIRKLNIYLPEGYSPQSATTYPVIYLLDGSSNEYFVNVVGLVHYFNSRWTNRLPKSIVVGIANVNRNRDLTFATSNTDFYAAVGMKKSNFPISGGSNRFISFIEKELQPYIEKNYRTNSSKTIIGQSLGGLLATEILLKKPDLFNTYIIMSPSLWWDKESLLIQAPDLLKKNLIHQKRVYIGVANEIELMKNDVNNLFHLLQKNENIHAFYDYLPEEDHFTMIHQSVYNAFKLLNPK